MSSISIGGLPKRDPAPTAEDIIQGHQQLIERAHLRGIKIIGATLTPYEGALYFTPDGEKVPRQAVNQWLRTSNAYDGLIDFDSALKDPANPTKILPKYRLRGSPAPERSRLSDHGGDGKPRALQERRDGFQGDDRRKVSSPELERRNFAPATISTYVHAVEQ